VDSQSFPLDKLAENENFTNLLKTSSIRTMHSQEASLDDVFSRVTGASLGAGE
jgi:fluoroquinolone transport system ATP-binding protein